MNGGVWHLYHRVLLDGFVLHVPLWSSKDMGPLAREDENRALAWMTSDPAVRRYLVAETSRREWMAAVQNARSSLSKASRTSNEEWLFAGRVGSSSAPWRGVESFRKLDVASSLHESPNSQLCWFWSDDGRL